MRQKIQRLLLILIVTFCSSGCAEILYGVVCVGGIVFSSDTRHKALLWPDARVNEPYQAILPIGYMARPALAEDDVLPDGLVLSFWYKDDNGDLQRMATPGDLTGEVTRKSGEVALRLDGTPTKAGKYRFNVISHSMPTMCGNSDDIHPLRIRVE